MRQSGKCAGWGEQHQQHLLPSHCQVSRLLPQRRVSEKRSDEEQMWHLFCCWGVSQRWEGSVRGDTNALRPQEGRRESSVMSRKKSTPHFHVSEFNSVLWLSQRASLGQWKDFNLFSEVYIGLCSPMHLHATNHYLALQLEDTKKWRLLPSRETHNWGLLHSSFCQPKLLG